MAEAAAAAAAAGAKGPAAGALSPANNRAQMSAEKELDPFVAARFRAVLESALVKLALVDCVSELMSNDERNARKSGADLSGLVREEKELESKFERLMAKRDSLRGLLNKAKLGETQAEVQQILQRLRAAKSAVYTRMFNENAPAVEPWKRQKDRKELEELLDTLTRELEGRHYSSLVRQVLQRGNRQQQLAERKAKWASLERAIQDVSNEIEGEKLRVRKLMAEKEERVKALMARRRALLEESGVVLKMADETNEGEFSVLERLRKLRIEELGSEIGAVERAVGEDAAVHEAMAAFLQKRRKNLEQDERDWEIKYKQDYTAICAELETLRAQRQRNLAALEALRKRRVEEERVRVESAALLAEEKRAMALRKKLRETMYIAVCRIRFYWRVYRRRKLAQKKKKGGKAKGKGKGKGKGKKK